jgi:hypothetical protein
MAESITITDYKDIRRLRTRRPQNRDAARSKLRPVHALDTETYQGNVFLIADSDGRFLDEITPDTIIKFLFHKKYQNSWNFFYNLGYDAEVILKLLGSELFRYRRTRKLSFKFQNYKIEYYPNKCLKINKGHHSVLFFDIAQFYDRKSLSVAYQNNVGKLSDDYLEMKDKRSEFSPWFYNHNKKKIRSYCIQDCIYTKELSEKWVELFHDAFSFYPAKWPSSGYLAEKVLINNGIEFPKFSSTPFEVQDLAYRSYFGGRFEMIKRGFIGQAYLYDINSAYPFAITQIPDLTDGKWTQRKSIHPDAKVGFFEIEADIPDHIYIPPFPFKANGQIVFPSGKFITFVTLAELQNCDKSWYKIRNSWQFVPSSDAYPYQEFIENLYQKRLELKQSGSPMQLPIKIILNSIYGKTGQKINRIIGNLFNPVIFSFITGFTRAQLYRFVVDNEIEREVVAFATDSICVTKKLDIDSNSLGKFHFEKSAKDVFYLQNGFYRFDHTWKQRGLGKLGSKEIEHIDTFEKNGKLLCQLEVKRNTRLRSSILQDNLSEIGKIKSITREINLNADRKRFWLGKIENIESKMVNESVPISLNHFAKDQI